jgi:hypothetical protein
MDVASVIAFHPIYQRDQRLTGVEDRRVALRGLAAAVLRVAPVLSTALKGDQLTRFDLV